MGKIDFCPTENEVIDAAVLKLEDVGFNILSTCNTKEHGTDIVAEKNGIQLLIEAKGSTSSMDGSRRSGKPFTRNQAHTHISVAIYKVMSIMSEHENDSKTLVGICLPFEKNHIEFIKRVKHSLNKLGILLIWVKENDVIIETENEEARKLFIV